MTRFLRAALFLGLSFGGPAWAGDLQPSQRLELTESLERRIRQGTLDLLGPPARAVVSVTWKASDKKPSEVSQTTVEDSLLFSSYLPPPEAGQPKSPDDDASSAVVRIQVEKSISPEQIVAVENLAKNMLADFQGASVEVKADLPPPAKDESLATSQDPRSPASETSAAPSALESFASRFGMLTLAASALIAALALMGVLKSSAHELSLSLRSLASIGSASHAALPPSPTSLTTSSIPPPALKGDTDRGASPPPVAASRLDFRRNLQIIERALEEVPVLFARSVGSSSSDLMGIKFLVAKLDAKSQGRIKELLGVDRILRAGSFRTGEDIVGFDAVGWIQQLAERIETRKLVGGSLLDEVLSKEEFLVLSNASPEAIFGSALKMNSPAVWRVVTEFVSVDFLRAHQAELDERYWIGIVEGAYTLEPESLRKSAAELIDQVRLSTSENVVQLRNVREREGHFLDRILPVLADAILAKDFGEDDAFVEKLVSERAEFAQVLRDKIWTPGRLNEVTDAALKEIFLGPALTSELRASLLCAFPPTIAARLESFLPEGNAKKIVVDLAARLRSTADAPRKVAMHRLAREFLDHLRTRALAGRLELVSQVPDEAPPSEPEVVDSEEPAEGKSAA